MSRRRARGEAPYTVHAADDFFGLDHAEAQPLEPATPQGQAAFWQLEPATTQERGRARFEHPAVESRSIADPLRAARRPVPLIVRVATAAGLVLAAAGAVAALAVREIARQRMGLGAARTTPRVSAPAVGVWRRHGAAPRLQLHSAPRAIRRAARSPRRFAAARATTLASRKATTASARPRVVLGGQRGMARRIATVRASQAKSPIRVARTAGVQPPARSPSTAAAVREFGWER